MKRFTEERGLRCFSTYPEFNVFGIGGECPETLKSVDELLVSADMNASVLLVTDNPEADHDVPSWVSVKGYAILEKRIEPPLKYYVIGKAEQNRN